MREPAVRQAARGDVFLFAGCIALALLALALPRSWTLSFSAALRQTAFRPLVALQSRAGLDRTSRFDLAQVRRSRDSLALLVQQQSALRLENDNLRGLVGLRARLTQPAVPAEILHQPTPTDPRMVLLNVGRADGVRVFDPVVTAEGLIGSIVSTSAHSSNALTWVNPDFAASAETVDSRVRGFVHPAAGAKGSTPLLEMQGVTLRDSMPVGTVVLTAGAGGVYPVGIPIGRVVSIGREANGYASVYRVLPFSYPGDAVHVLVLVTPRDSVYPKAQPLTAPPPMLPAPLPTSRP
ncbi:MAG: rod shape-determining protein MreC [Gemmatimonadales bacterium]